MKTVKASGLEPPQKQQTKDPKEPSEEELKNMIEIVSIEEVYIEALQVKHPIIAGEALEFGQRDFQYYRLYKGQREGAVG
ncbi:hypothetical protein Tco_0234364 [Tanacetum coccineum]